MNPSAHPPAASPDDVAPRRLCFGRFQIDFAQRQLLADGVPLSLGARAFDVLRLLITNRGRVVSRKELMDVVWPGVVVEENNLSVQIGTLRRLLGLDVITTVAGRGYVFTATVPAALKSAVLPANVAADGAAQPRMLVPPLDMASLAVLPFANLSDDPAQDYFVDGVVDDITRALSRVRSFFVIARSSSFTYKGRAVDVSQVGRDLGVRYVVEGSFRQAGARLRLSVQLVDAATGRVIWSQGFEGKREDIFALQDQITAQVAAAVEPNLLQADLELTRAKPADSLQAYELCLRALPHIHLPASRQQAEQTLAWLGQAMAMSPGYLYAKALYCWAHVTASGAHMITIDEARPGLPVALQLLADHRDDPTALAYAGHSVAYIGRMHQRGLHALDRALALNPHSLPALCSSGWVRIYANEAATATGHFERAIRLNPLAPQHSYLLSGLGWAQLMCGRLDDALATLQEAFLEAGPWSTTLLGIIDCLARLERWDEARAGVVQLLQGVPDLSVSGYRAMTPDVPSEFLDQHMALMAAAGMPP